LPTDRFEDALQQITHDFAMQLVELIRSTTLDELTRVTQLRGTEVEAEARMKTKAAAPPEQVARRRGRPPKKVAAPPAGDEVEAPKAAGTVEVAAEPASPAKKAKKARSWPTCSVEGCGKKMYPGSGKSRLCYSHHLDAGGKPTPLVAARKKKARAAAEVEATTTPEAAPKVPDAPEAVPAAQATEAPEAPETPETPKATEAPKASPKKRPWPTCSVEGCDKNVYMPSGAKKMCYQHNLEHGGKPTPLARVNKARKAAGRAKAKRSEAPAAPKAAKAEKPKTIRRKKTEKAET